MTAKELAASSNLLAIEALEAGRGPEVALGHYLEALAHEPDSATIHYNIGALYDEFFKDFSKARDHYEQALELKPHYMDARIALCELGIEEGDFEGAMKHARYVETLEPKNARNLNNIGCLLVKKDDDYREAVGYFEQTVLLEPDNGVAFANLADAYLHLGENEEAAAAYGEALRLEPDNPVYCYHYAQLLRHYFHDIEEAETYYKKAIRLAPRELAPYRALRSIYTFDLQDDAKGVQTLEAALKYFPSDTALLMEIAGIYDYQLGDYEKAKNYYEKVVSLEPNRIQAWSALGTLCAEMLKDHERGLEAYLRVLELDSDNLHGNLNLGHLYFYRFKNPEEAHRHYQKAVELMKGTPEEASYGGEVYLSLGILHEQYLKDIHSAMELYEKAIEIGDEEIAKRRLLMLYQEDLRIH